MFVESSPAWAERVAATLPTGGWEITPHDYGTRVGDGLAVVGHSLPAAVTSRTWDVILVDGPRGVDADDPGRVVPIRAAAKLAKRDGWRMFVHDCDQPLEQAAYPHFFDREPARAYDRTWAYGADHDPPL
ncbi:hypothetical protein [Limnoglobus roseus]|uniref:Uncharacterized protein n=1 Tax=Limnoglobus roseus TaxID=2598579 RepID=A0A5C1AL55_9BACT|nr:hypothetical protein [Limnoglobus roseus]QEL18917.1 hypothetical protein PX52LOC_05967 [Limnoglobus roseus]